MKHKWIFLLLLLTRVAGFSQPDFQLAGEIRGLANGKVSLLSFFGERTSLLDSARTDAGGNFMIPLPATLAPGLYRVSWGKDLHIDLIINQENIRFTTKADAPADSLQILASGENILYYDYMDFDRSNQMKLELIQPLVDYYPDRDEFYKMAMDQYDRIQRGQSRMLDSLQKALPGSYAVRMFRLYSTPYLPASIPPETRSAYLKQHFFDLTDFNDTSLLRSNAWPNKAIAYLSLYSNPRMSQKQLETEFIKAVTVILSAAGENPEIFSYLLDYLVTGFDKFHFEEVITYIAENFEDPSSCENSEKKSALQKKLETFKKIATGQPAPDFESIDTSGIAVKISSAQTPYTLLLFWSTECPHCLDMLPKVKAVYEAQNPKRMEIISMAIDTSRSAWLQVTREEKLPWINLSDLKGFDSPAADLYNIYATPTMFLLDSTKTIIAKPISYRELEVVLRENGL